MSDLMQINTTTPFFDNVARTIEEGRRMAGRAVNLSMCATYYEVGRQIVEEEQGGKARAEYGRELIKELSKFLTAKFGRGHSISTLKNARQFYNIYAPTVNPQIAAQPAEKSQTAFGFFDRNNLEQKSQTAFDKSYPFALSWSHYLVLIRIKNADERRFYEIEAVKQQWSHDWLSRQYNSSLYERLALSRDKDEVMRLANEGQLMEKPQDVLKNPLVLEFTGLEERAEYSETELETAIFDKLSRFLLELGKGFLFEARQKRFTFDEQHFFVDLVFYNRLLQCYVLIDLKTTTLKHQDLGQMQMYVNYFDRYVKTEKETPSIGILLCKEKNDNMVELTLPEDANIYASEYSLYLPDKALLQRKLAEWVEEFEKAHGGIAEGA
jgi:predicted nuclease of restriction endonuclease-like (RecB) superfamily